MMVRVSPAARKSKLLSAALNVAVIDPAWKSVVSAVTESAPASTAASPLGGAAPLDQVIVARLALTVPEFRSKWVKPRVAEGAVSRPVLPGVWGISVIGFDPASADSTGSGGFRWTTSKNPELFCVMVRVTWPAAASVPVRAKLIG